MNKKLYLTLLFILTMTITSYAKIPIFSIKSLENESALDLKVNISDSGSFSSFYYADFVSLVGNTAETITHNLNSINVQVSYYRTIDGETVNIAFIDTEVIVTPNAINVISSETATYYIVISSGGLGTRVLTDVNSVSIGDNISTLVNDSGFITTTPDSYIKNYESDVMSGTLTATAFIGDGSSLTGVSSSWNDTTDGIYYSNSNGGIKILTDQKLTNQSDTDVTINYTTYDADGFLTFKIDSVAADQTKIKIMGAANSSSLLRFADGSSGAYGIDMLMEDNTFTINGLPSQARFKINDENNGIDFLVGGEATDNLFYIDASTNNVGINTNTPSDSFYVNGSATITSSITADTFIGDGSQLTFDSYSITVSLDTDMVADTTYNNYKEITAASLGLSSFVNYDYIVYESDTITLSGDTIEIQVNGEFYGYRNTYTAFRFYSTLKNYYSGFVTFFFKKRF